MTPSSTDIGEHLDFLSGLGCGKSVIEFGFRCGNSARAFLRGGCKRLVSYDINDCLPFSDIRDPRFTFRKEHSLCIMPETCDLLFIDSTHTGEHLLQELERHGDTASMIAMHDTHCRKYPDMMQALRRFLNTRPAWRIVTDFENNNGLTVIGR